METVSTSALITFPRYQKCCPHLTKVPRPRVLPYDWLRSPGQVLSSSFPGPTPDIRGCQGPELKPSGHVLLTCWAAQRYGGVLLGHRKPESDRQLG